MKKFGKVLAAILSGIIVLSSNIGAVALAETSSEAEVDLSQYNSLVTADRFTDLNSVRIGSGGYITGLVIHPEDSDIMYIRTDVGGAYRWEEETESWTQLLMFFKLDGQYLVDGICLDPNNKDVVYICVGGNDAESSGIWRSEDRGDTWTEISPDYDIIFYGNKEHRGNGECIAVDPNNSDVLWVGTRGTGLHKTSDGGKTWENVKLSNGKEEIRCIIYDPSETLNGKSKTIYAVSLYDGLYRSTDAGETWNKVEGLPDAACYHEAHLDSKGRVLITFGERRMQNLSYPAVRGVWRLDTDGETWENFGENLPEDGFTTYMALEVDDDDPNRVAVGVGTGLVSDSGETYWCPPIYYTTDGGKTWTDVTPALNSPYVEKMASGWKGGGHSSGCVGSLTFGDDDELWMTDWTEVYYTENVSAKSDKERAWRTYIGNIEELVTFSMLSIPNGKNDNLFMAADVKCAFAINDDKVYDYPSHPKEKGVFQQADYCAGEPDFIVGAHTGQSSSLTKAKGTVYISEDCGGSWTASAGWDAENHPGDAAVSADDPNKIVVATLEGKIFYSHDRGESWTEYKNPSWEFLPDNVWHNSSPLESDKNKGNIFYIMTPFGFYRSEDYGVTWSRASTEPKMKFNEPGIRVLTYEGSSGEVWVSSSSGVWYSEDYGDTFSQIEGLYNGNITLGRGRENGKYVLYFCGYLGTNERAVYASENKGETFTRLTDYNEYSLVKTSKIYASKNQYGRIYFGSSGLGWLYMDALDSNGRVTDDIGNAGRIWIDILKVAIILICVAAFFLVRRKLIKR